MERINRRKIWLLFVLGASLASIFIGKEWLFTQAACPRLQDVLLYSFAVIGAFIGLIYVLVVRNDSLVTRVMSVSFVFGGILLIAGISGAILGNMPSMQVVYCNPGLCDRATLAKSMRETGKLDGAEQVARTCVQDVSNGLLPQACQQDCARELSLTLYTEAGNTIDSLRGTLNGTWKPYCEEAQNQLQEARGLASTYKYNDLVSSIDERQKRLSDKCEIAPIPTPTEQLEILRQQKGPITDLVDVRVLANNEFLSGLQPGNFSLSAGGISIPFDFQERNTDDPICMVAVIDNSGSIYPGLSQIGNAIAELNYLHKPNDQLGLVVFSGRNDINVVQLPSLTPLSSGAINALGRTTALWDGILKGLDVAQSCSVKNRYLMVMTDGKDNDSQHLTGDDMTKAHAIDGLASQQGVDICVVGVTDQVDQPSLQAVATGCNYLPAVNYDDVATEFQSIFGYIRDFYRLSFSASSPPPDGQLILSVKGAGEVTVDFSKP